MSDCFGNYGLGRECQECKVTSSCKRERIKIYKDLKKKRGPKRIDKDTVHRRFRNKLLDSMMFMKEPLSTTEILRKVKNWETLSAGYDEVKDTLFELKQMGYVLLLRRGRGNARYWIVAANHRALF